MNPSRWFRALSVVLGLFAVGHTLGTAAPRVTRGAPEAAVFAAMQSFRFPVMGFERTYWDFYRGFVLLISLQLVVMAIIAWQLGKLSSSSPRQAMPIAITLQVACIGLFALACLFFFAAPIVLSLFAAVLSSIAVALLARTTSSHRDMTA